ncbi:homoserine/homoserine lactone efflux protein [Agarivorans sp. B2Z047]|uniref:homoserine/homoserine lactone efflux protein n=1 Tax=unclassified Agarivorans TaxID=2636026 RepID=UPI00128D1FA3|nr:homoserine/homoserine lactone efflux protein [Agarivorans sp. B2Z047]MPW29541.1 homoserine/homoserine lactone efflux protein [Agarivorans sp. B2Z047]UQN45128.1 homoserine/homoserine lactone efflux protein [Agarivorans sp. B2Z047]
MLLSVWLTFVAACIVFSISPGAGTVATISHSLSGGFKQACKNIAGLQLALVTHLLIVSIGLGALLASSAIAFTVVKYLGAAYLLYLGISKFFEKSVALTGKDVAVKSSSQLIKQGFIVNLMNPKSIIFLAAFLPQFVNPTQDMTGQYLLLGLTVVMIDCAVMFSYATLASAVKPWLGKAKFVALQNRVFGSLFVMMGIALARVER